ncbi:MAG: TatD family hydrolase, partial [Pseudobdellovibrionaceae bacterium]
VLEIAKKRYPQVFCTLGVHPHEAKVLTDEVLNWIETHATEKEVIAVGEIGLDYYYTHSEKNIQIEAFEKQLSLAKKLKMPVEIHTRDAEADTVEILKKFKGDVKGIIHCFTGSEWLAFQCLDLGFNISISGVVTFKNADSLRQSVKKLPLDRIHVETDAPFLAPIPQRGKSNTPAFVVHTAQAVADLQGIPLIDLQRVTNSNAEKLFSKLI